MADFIGDGPEKQVTQYEKRWNASAFYTDDAGKEAVFLHSVEELEELQKIIEQGPDWSRLIRIEIRLSRPPTNELTMSMSQRPEPPIDPRPASCRFRLQQEGKAYPRSSCTACGKTVTTGLGVACSIVFDHEPGGSHPAADRPQ